MLNAFLPEMRIEAGWPCGPGSWGLSQHSLGPLTGPTKATQGTFPTRDAGKIRSVFSCGESLRRQPDSAEVYSGAVFAWSKADLRTSMASIVAAAALTIAALTTISTK